MPFFSFPAPMAIAALTAIVAACPAAFAQQAQDVAQAERAAEQWLHQADEGQYGAAWDASAPVLHATVPRAQWLSTMEAVRTPLGAVRQRVRRSATFMREMPGVPDGEYVVIQYETVFENKAKSVETITPLRDKDGKWRVSGYFIQ
ncbi:MAG: DUF4019 domain-containing protein [Acidovorax sp.]|nr:DUF4019 domain-containing protein [Acidovorax sp.]